MTTQVAPTKAIGLAATHITEQRSYLCLEVCVLGGVYIVIFRSWCFLGLGYKKFDRVAGGQKCVEVPVLVHARAFWRHSLRTLAFKKEERKPITLELLLFILTFHACG